MRMSNNEFCASAPMCEQSELSLLLSSAAASKGKRELCTSFASVLLETTAVLVPDSIASRAGTVNYAKQASGKPQAASVSCVASNRVRPTTRWFVEEFQS